MVQLEKNFGPSYFVTTLCFTLFQGEVHVFNTCIHSLISKGSYPTQYSGVSWPAGSILLILVSLVLFETVQLSLQNGSALQYVSQK